MGIYYQLWSHGLYCDVQGKWHVLLYSFWLHMLVNWWSIVLLPVLVFCLPSLFGYFGSGLIIWVYSDSVWLPYGPFWIRYILFLKNNSCYVCFGPTFSHPYSRGARNVTFVLRAALISKTMWPVKSKRDPLNMIVLSHWAQSVCYFIHPLGSIHGDNMCMYFEPNKKHTDVHTYLAIKA